MPATTGPAPDPTTCATCRGTRRVGTVVGPVRNGHPMALPCPDCTPTHHDPDRVAAARGIAVALAGTVAAVLLVVAIVAVAVVAL